MSRGKLFATFAWTLLAVRRSVERSGRWSSDAGVCNLQRRRVRPAIFRLRTAARARARRLDGDRIEGDRVAGNRVTLGKDRAED